MLTQLGSSAGTLPLAASVIPQPVGSAGTLSLAASVIPRQAPLLRRSAGTLSLAASVSPRQAVPPPSWAVQCTPTGSQCYSPAGIANPLAGKEFWHSLPGSQCYSPAGSANPLAGKECRHSLPWQPVLVPGRHCQPPSCRKEC